jgi:hypothetical protein
MSESPAASATPSPQKLLQLHMLKRRRRRVWLNTVGIVLITLLMVLLSVAERDRQSLRGSVLRCQKDLEYAREVLQAGFDAGRPAPAKMPLPAVQIPPDLTPKERERFDQQREDWRRHYLYRAGHRGQVRVGKPVVVCQDEHMHDLYINPDQLHVILFDGQTYELKTLHKDDLAQMADTPGWTPPK